MRLHCAAECIIVLCALNAVSALRANREGLDPVLSEISLGAHNTSKSTADISILPHSDNIASELVGRQVVCSDSSTSSFCKSGYCFLSSTSGSSSWGTCCPAGWSLWLNSAEWSKQKCCPPGVSSDQCGSDGDSEAPIQPSQCGNGGVISGWACVYSDQTSDGRARARWSPATLIALSVFWLGICAR